VNDHGSEKAHGVFDVAAIAASLPATADTMLVDTRMTDEAGASSRIFRVYRETPPHYHATCDEYLYMLSGRVVFVIDGGPPLEIKAGQLLFLKRNTVHAMPEILEGPVVLMAVDTPGRAPTDIVFVDPSDGTPASFIRDRDGS
jgi:mannose-6-phosphate isomerase-like protein (cupin superfamily)